MTKCKECGLEHPNHTTLCTMDCEPIVEELPEPIIEELADGFDIYDEMLSELKNKLKEFERKYKGRVVKTCSKCNKDYIVSKHQLSCPMAYCQGILTDEICKAEEILQDQIDKHEYQSKRIKELDKLYEL
jgi:hypothetical protein